MTIKERTIKLLDFDKILQKVADFALSSTAKKRILEYVPDYDLKTARYLKNLTEEATIIRSKYML